MGVEVRVLSGEQAGAQGELHTAARLLTRHGADHLGEPLGFRGQGLSLDPPTVCCEPPAQARRIIGRMEHGDPWTGAPLEDSSDRAGAHARDDGDSHCPEGGETIGDDPGQP